MENRKSCFSLDEINDASMCLLLSFPYGNNHKTSNNNRSGGEKGMKKRDVNRGLCGEALQGFWGLFQEKVMKTQIF